MKLMLVLAMCLLAVFIPTQGSQLRTLVLNSGAKGLEDVDVVLRQAAFEMSPKLMMAYMEQNLTKMRQMLADRAEVIAITKEKGPMLIFRGKGSLAPPAVLYYEKVMGWQVMPDSIEDCCWFIGMPHGCRRCFKATVGSNMWTGIKVGNEWKVKTIVYGLLNE